MKSVYIYIGILVGTFSLNAQGEGGVFTAQRLAAIKTGEGSLGNNPSALNWFNDLRNKTARLGSERKLSLEDIQGSVYVDENFKMGTIYYRYQPYVKYELRYDAFNDEVELKRNAEGPIEALHKSEAISCQIGGEEYNYVSFKNSSGKIKQGYLIPIYKGELYTLYIRRAKIFKEGKEAKTSLQNSFPHRFLDEQTYFLSIDDDEPLQIKTTKKEVMNWAKADDKNKVKTFFKENNINLKEKQGLVRTVAFLDAL